MRQGSLFDIDPLKKVIGLAGLMPCMRADMNIVADEYPDGRKMLVDAVNGIFAREGVSIPGGAKSITLDTLNKWLQPGERGHEPSLMAIVCFCLATGDARPLQHVFRALGLEIIRKEDRWYLELGMVCEQERELKERKTELKARKRMMEKR